MLATHRPDNSPSRYRFAAPLNSGVGSSATVCLWPIPGMRSAADGPCVRAVAMVVECKASIDRFDTYAKVGAAD